MIGTSLLDSALTSAGSCAVEHASVRMNLRRVWCSVEKLRGVVDRLNFPPFEKLKEVLDVPVVPE